MEARSRACSILDEVNRLFIKLWCWRSPRLTFRLSYEGRLHKTGFGYLTTGY